MRSRRFDRDVQVAEWTTYDKTRKIYSVTKTKAPAKAATPKTPTRIKRASPTKAAAKASPKSSKTPTMAKASAELTADDLLVTLDHPLAAEIELVRKAILSTDKSISDGVKWNSLSFQTTEWFATVNLRSRDSLQLVMHLGAKAGKEAPVEAIPDPKGLLKWLGKDRALATLGTGAEVKAALPSFKAIVKAWIRYV